MPTHKWPSETPQFTTLLTTRIYTMSNTKLVFCISDFTYINSASHCGVFVSKDDSSDEVHVHNHSGSTDLMLIATLQEVHHDLQVCLPSLLGPLES